MRASGGQCLTAAAPAGSRTDPVSTDSLCVWWMKTDPGKFKKYYLLTLQVNRYCLFALQGRYHIKQLQIQDLPHRAKKTVSAYFTC